MSLDEAALAWARARAGGPYQVPAGSTAIPGTERLVEPVGMQLPLQDAAGDGRQQQSVLVWLVPQLPDSADARVLKELNLTGVPVDQPNDTARLLAACLRCCWPDPTDPPWPGVPAPRSAAITLFRELTAGREADAQHRAAVAAVSRLAASGWLLTDEGRQTLRLGPRVALWSQADLTVLRQLWHALPAPGGSDA